MESRFDKYLNVNTCTSNHISNVNIFINHLEEKGLPLIEKEIQSLNEKIEEGNAPNIFSIKVKLLARLGKAIEEVYETYHFNKKDNNYTA